MYFIVLAIGTVARRRSCKKKNHLTPVCFSIWFFWFFFRFIFVAFLFIDFIFHAIGFHVFFYLSKLCTNQMICQNTNEIIFNISVAKEKRRQNDMCSRKKNCIRYLRFFFFFCNFWIDRNFLENWIIWILLVYDLNGYANAYRKAVIV